jgi:hypothetical protein
MQAQAVTGAGPWIPIDPGKSRSVQVVITGTASVDIEASNDGVNAVPALQAGITASAGYVDSDPWLYIRANVKSISSGTVSVFVGAAS